MVAFLFGFQNVQGIIIAGLVSLIIVLIYDNRRTEAKIKELDSDINTVDETLNKKIDTLAEATSESFGNLSGAFSEDMQVLANEIGSDIHELATLIADHRYGDEGN